MADLTQAGGLFDPAEHHLNVLAASLAGRVTVMLHGPSVNRRASSGLACVVSVLRDVRRQSRLHREVARVDMLLRVSGVTGCIV